MQEHMYYPDLPCWCGGMPAFGIPHREEVNMRYNCEIIRVENANEEESLPDLHYADLIELINTMQDGDDLVVHAVER